MRKVRKVRKMLNLQMLAYDGDVGVSSSKSDCNQLLPNTARPCSKTKNKAAPQHGRLDRKLFNVSVSPSIKVSFPPSGLFCAKRRMLAKGTSNALVESTRTRTWISPGSWAGIKSPIATLASGV
jgi:hypothetical protein